MTELMLSDVWRARNPQVKKYSWWRTKPKFTASRLDFMLADVATAQMVAELGYSRAHKTDHCKIKTRILLNRPKRGPGTWKINNLLLYDNIFLNKLEEIINKYTTYVGTLTPDIIWELFKQETIYWAQDRSKQKAREKKQKIVLIEQQIEQLTNAIQLQIVDESLAANSINELNEELDTLQSAKTNGIMFRSRAKWIAEGERNTKYFYALEKRNYTSKVVQRLQIADESGSLTMVTDPDIILEEQRAFYQRLYTRDTEVVFSIQNSTDHSLLECDRHMLDQPITLQECTDSLMSMKNDKTPGLDGLTVELYKKIWPKIGPLYLDNLNYCYDMGRLHRSGRKGLITLIPKKDRDTSLLKNWRPLTMLTLDYKILAKTLATRLKQCLPYLISLDQTGFMEERQISTTIRRTMDILYYSQKQADNVQGYYM